MDGFLLVDKPKGWTSHDVVAKVRGILKNEDGKKIKVGHTGTLDPMATGLLVLVVGSYCKRASEFSKLDKTYEASLYLGETSDTGDAEGVKTKISDRQPSKNEVGEALKPFLGDIEQTPPAYSAIKVNGKRAYKLSREGKKVDLEPRIVHIYNLKLESYTYPTLNITTSVSSGVYIRSLAEDIGSKLGVGAYLSGLKRTEVGKYKLAQSAKIEAVNIDKLLKI